VIPTIWYNCYAQADGGWEGIVTPESMSHPAKMSRRLCERIIDLGIERGWWTPGESVIGDPFGGIGSTGLIAQGRGLRCILVELEAKFVALAEQNFARWRDAGPRPVMIQGDSQQVLAGAGARMAASCKGDGYGTSPGQIGALKEGSLEGIVTSPPYAESVKGEHAERETSDESTAARRTEGGSLGQSQRHGGYGAAHGTALPPRLPALRGPWVAVRGSPSVAIPWRPTALPTFDHAKSKGWRRGREKSGRGRAAWGTTKSRLVSFRGRRGSIARAARAGRRKRSIGGRGGWSNVLLGRAAAPGRVFRSLSHAAEPVVRIVVIVVVDCAADQGQPSERVSNPY